MSGISSAPSDALVGRTLLGRYRIVRRLAEGGMGVVYLARVEGAAGFIKPAVIKLILQKHASDPYYLGMFVREAQILAQLRHPGIVDVIEFGEQDGAYVMVLEYVSGYHLGEWTAYLRRKRRELPTELSIQIVISVLDALHHVHTQTQPDGTPLHITHRDVSPSNVLLSAEGYAKLADFGVARMQADTLFRTQAGGFRGKLAYGAPEIFHGAEATPQSDLYACGVMLHELLLGRNAFAGRTQAATLQLAMHHIPESVHAVREDAPDDIDAILARALAKEPAQRYASAAEFAQALRQTLRAREPQLRAQLAALLRADGDEMAALLGLESLAQRDRAWRRFSVPPPPPPPSLVPTGAPFAPVSGRPVSPAAREQTTGVLDDSLSARRSPPRGSSDFGAAGNALSKAEAERDVRARASDRASAGVGASEPARAGAETSTDMHGQAHASELRRTGDGADVPGRAAAGEGVRAPAGVPASDVVALGAGAPAGARADPAERAAAGGQSTAVATTIQAQPPARSRWPWSIGALGVVVALAAVLWSLQRLIEPPQRIVLVQSREPLAVAEAVPAGATAPELARGVDPGAGATPSAAAVAAPSGEATIDPTAAARGSVTASGSGVRDDPRVAVAASGSAQRADGANTERDAPRPAALTRAFRSQQRRVEVCFAQHARELPAGPQIEIHFQIDARGRAQQAALIPAALDATPLGACLRKVALATRFPSHGRDVSFRIPVTARRVQAP
jgi:serine/threonine protein kinase